MTEIVQLERSQKLSEDLINYVEAKWPEVVNVVVPVIKESQRVTSGLPFVFVLLKNKKIIGFYQIIKQEIVLRKDISPWISPIFVDEQERGNSYGKLMLNHARKVIGDLGYQTVYLATDHIGYYEKYGFREIGLSNFEWGRPTKIYKADAIK